MSTQPSGPTQARLNQIESILPSLGKDLLDLQFGDLGVETKSNNFDLLTTADKISESRLVDYISEQFKEDIILAEEGGADLGADGRAEYRWIIDPLDGTTNFLHGHPINAGTAPILPHALPRRAHVGALDHRLHQALIAS